MPAIPHREAGVRLIKLFDGVLNLLHPRTGERQRVDEDAELSFDGLGFALVQQAAGPRAGRDMLNLSLQASDGKYFIANKVTREVTWLEPSLKKSEPRLPTLALADGSQLALTGKLFAATRGGQKVYWELGALQDQPIINHQ